ncbi:MAG: tRNA (adenosine(37)-N6)-threonylcarbamoyltransferase complex transferase subunit TsaD, partial [Mariprofundaceae bacterium]|nr:tRNA (adenosine(37)-N6)-threonylcarbamoyltransferase complex transferase subunit TsaD [Mariprofundaceae bacterium]
MRVLGIETSCDETAAAIYAGSERKEGRILAEHIASQIETHARFGGIVPEIASREHLRLLPPMVDEVMAEAETSWQDIDAIAVTAGPGLMGALLVGVAYARAAGAANDIPVIPVHHMEGHLLAPGLEHTLPPFPFITLLVSGGHTMLVRVNAIGSYHVIGQTLDDAAGECFDKCARLLGLPYPGGPALACLAKAGNPDRFSLPRPMLKRDNLHFSFSGLKTAAMHAVQKIGSDRDRCDLAAGIEAAIVDVLVAKSIRACIREEIDHLVIAGGVAANQLLRHIFTRAAEKHAI